MKNVALVPGNMGGFGSGREQYATTPEDRECLKLDVNEFTDILNADEMYTGTISWGDSKIAWETTDEGGEQLRLKYTATLGGESQEQECPIRITRTECNFGGTRPWWRCPGCRDRVGTLYLPPTATVFRCRGCHDVAYTSSRASGNDDRTLRMRYNRVRKKLGAEPAHPESMEAGIPDRPKGMHEETYNDLISELQLTKDEWSRKALLEPMRKHYGLDWTDDLRNDQ